ncbi:MAG: triose-phosphate isomerase, partial [Hyphomicrobiales bacterium]
RGGTTLSVVEQQLAGSVPLGATSRNTIIAYEPVWAIGTGLTPETEDVAEVHGFMRSFLEDRFSEEGTTMRLLYGGSVKPGNASELMLVPHVNGALVGGASLKASDFLGILRAIS